MFYISFLPSKHCIWTKMTLLFYSNVYVTIKNNWSCSGMTWLYCVMDGTVFMFHIFVQQWKQINLSPRQRPKEICWYRSSHVSGCLLFTSILCMYTSNVYMITSKYVKHVTTDDIVNYNMNWCVRPLVHYLSLVLELDDNQSKR